MENKDNLKYKIKKISHESLAEAGITSKTLGFIFQQYEEKYGRGNVLMKSDGIYILIKLNMDNREKNEMNIIQTYEEFEKYLDNLPRDFTDFESLGVPAWVIDRYFSRTIIGERSK